MEDYSVIMVKRLKDSSLWVGFLKDFLIEFKKEIYNARLNWTNYNVDEVELIACEIWCNKYNKNAQDYDIWSEQTYLKILQETYEERFHRYIKFNINFYNEDIEILNTFEITLNNYGETFLEKSQNILTID